MIAASEIELRAGSDLLLTVPMLRVDKGDRIGLVGRNGAGKTTLTRVLAGESAPASGNVKMTGTVGYLPQDPRTADPTQLASSRILSARGLDAVSIRMSRAAEALATPGISSEDFEKAGDRYNRALGEFEGLGGYTAESEAATIAASIGLDERILIQPLGTLSGGQRRRVELTRILFSDADVLLLDEPTNHLDADSIRWLRKYLAAYEGGFIVISHDTELLEETVNKVWHLDANRQEIDLYSMGWSKYLLARETDEKRRKRERKNAETTADTLRKQAERMRAKASKAKAAQSMFKRADRIMSETATVLQKDNVAKLRFPTPKACGRVPLMAENLSRSYGSLEVFTDVNLAIDRGSKVVILGLNGAGKTTMLRILAGIDPPDTGARELGHGAVVGYYAQEHETLNPTSTVWETMAAAGSHLNDTQQRTILGSFLFQGDSVHKPTGVLRVEKKLGLHLPV
jgi:ATPase subunit of ABC transporter with duplicated ATPase domains